MKPTRSFLFVVTFSSLLCSALPGRAQDQAPVEQQKPKWDTTASAGLTLTRGNSETLLFAVTAATARTWDKNKLSLGADMTYGTTKDQTTDVTTRDTDSYHGYIQYDRLFTERFYGYARAEGLYDSIADIKYRAILSPGAGYYLIKQTNIDFCVEAGPAFIFQKLGDDESSYVTLRLAEKFHYALSDRARIWESVEWLPKVDDFNNYIVNAEAGIAADLTQKKNLSLSIVLRDTYNSVPATGRKENDLKLIAAVNYKL